MDVMRARAQVRDHDQQVDDARVPGHLRVAIARSRVSQGHTGCARSGREQRRHEKGAVRCRGKIIFVGSSSGGPERIARRRYLPLLPTRCVSDAASPIRPHKVGKGGHRSEVDRRCGPHATVFERADIDRAIEISTIKRASRVPGATGERASERKKKISFDDQIETKGENALRGE